MHQALQSINCPGCNNIFVKAALMIGHLERGYCKEIPTWEFRGHIQQKYIQKEVWKNPEAFTFMATVPPPVAPRDEPAAPTETESEGGVPVPLLDEEDEQQHGGQAPLQAEVELMELSNGKRAPLTRANLETWPRLPGQKKAMDMTKHLLKLSLNSDAYDSTEEMSNSDVTSRRGGVKIHTESYPSLQSPPTQSYRSPTTEDTSDGESSSGRTAHSDEVLKHPPAWQTLQTSRALFGKAKATPPNEVTRSILKKREDETRPMNPLTARWWEPGSKDYNPDFYFNKVVQKYCCPFPDCGGVLFGSPYDIDAHFMDIHARTNFRCPSCSKLFRCAEGLVAHCESNGNCPIQKHDDFDKVCSFSDGPCCDAPC